MWRSICRESERANERLLHVLFEFITNVFRCGSCCCCFLFIRFFHSRIIIKELFFRSLKTTESKSDFLHAKKTTTTTTAAGHKKYLCFNTSVANILEYSNLKECKVQEKNLNCFRTWSPYYNFSIASAQQYHHFLENLFIQTIHSFKSCKNLSKLWLRKWGGMEN